MEGRIVFEASCLAKFVDDSAVKCGLTTRESLNRLHTRRAFGENLGDKASF